MADAVIGKRPYHAFLSHAHVNKAQAEQLYDFLSRVAGIPVWYDAVNLPPGAPFVLGLYEAIVESRSAIILLSRESVESGWVEPLSGTRPWRRSWNPLMLPVPPALST